MSDNVVGEWHSTELKLHESKTIVCKFANSPRSADIAIITLYNAYGVPFFRSHKAFRFVGQRSGAEWHWLPEPTDEISGSIDKALEIYRHALEVESHISLPSSAR